MPKKQVAKKARAIVQTDAATITQLLGRSVIDIIPRVDVEKKLRSGKRLVVKLGIDPTGPDLHIGHAVPLRKLREFQEAGHEAALIIGDWTARIGDPTGRNEMRPPLTEAQVKKNAARFLEQAFLILDRKKTQVYWQGAWFKKFNLQNVIDLCSKFTVAQMLEREDFQNRQKQGIEIHYHEPLYSLLQAYDSVMVKADIELGDPAQLFNILKGRDLQRLSHQEPQGVITVGILLGLDGTNKMSKSLGNYVALLDEANDMYGKIMSIPDALIIQYFELATTIPSSELAEIERQLISKQSNPRDLKMRLAREIVGLYHSEKKAKAAEAAFVGQFQKRELPQDISEVTLKKWPSSIEELVVACGLAASMSEARRLLSEGGIKINGQIAPSGGAIPSPTREGFIVSRGKRQFKRVRGS